MKTRVEPLDFVLGISVAFVWGLGIVFAKAAIVHFPPILLMAFRFTLTAAVLAKFAGFPKHHLIWIFWISVISATIQYSLTFSGLKGLDAGSAALIVQLEVPFLVLIGAIFLGEKPGLRKWIGIGIAFLGVYLISGEPKIAQALWAVGFIIGGGIAWAIGQAMVRQIQDLSSQTVAAWVAIFACPQLFIMSAIFETGQIEAIKSAGWFVWAVVAYLGLIMTALGYFMWYKLVQRNPVSAAAPFLLLLPVFAILGGWLILGETLTTQVLLGGGIILFGVGLILTETTNTSQDH